MSFGLVGTVNNNGWKSPFRHETKYRAGYDKFKYYKTHYRGAKKAGTNDDRWRWTAWFDLDFAHQKIVLIERGELHRQADLKKSDPATNETSKIVWGSIKEKLLQNVNNLHSEKGVFLWFRQSGFTTTRN